MLDSATSPSAAEESRLELAVAAADAERANRPRWIVALGIVLLAIAIVFTLFQVSSRTAELIRVQVERDRTAKVENLKADLDRENARLVARGTKPDPRMGAKIEATAVRAGVLLASPVTDSAAAGLASVGMKQVTYRAHAVNQDPLSILNWLRIAQEEPDTAGLELLEVKLTPGAGTPTNSPGWNVDVQFTRWESTK
jgi:hypothetical protein